ncbi:MAG: hydroxymethylbilane synthase [Dehalococcoidia bacterium]|nr:MAG: hydroxymethylbilane synthase [Dehalococcoidia bacterium]
MSRTFVIGARGSKLSLRQVEMVSEALVAARPGTRLEVREIHTEGDRSTAPLAEIGGLGVFTKAIEDALLSRDVDIAIHSLKDLPADLAPGLTLASVPARADARDALVSKGGLPLLGLRRGARVGTGSGRRAVQIRALRPDVETVEVRGNVDTRIRKAESGEYDAVVLAMAGLTRLGLLDKVAQVFALAEVLPAVGQAALGIETRAGDDETIELVRAIDDAETHAAVEAERAYLQRLGGGCRLPVGAFAVVDDGELALSAMIAGGETIFRAEVRGPISEPGRLGNRAADDVLAQGAKRFME